MGVKDILARIRFALETGLATTYQQPESENDRYNSNLKYKSNTTSFHDNYGSNLVGKVKSLVDSFFNNIKKN